MSPKMINATHTLYCQIQINKTEERFWTKEDAEWEEPL